MIAPRDSPIKERATARLASPRTMTVRANPTRRRSAAVFRAQTPCFATTSTLRALTFLRSTAGTRRPTPSRPRPLNEGRSMRALHPTRRDPDLGRRKVDLAVADACEQHRRPRVRAYPSDAEPRGPGLAPGDEAERGRGEPGERTERARMGGGRWRGERRIVESHLRGAGSARDRRGPRSALSSETIAPSSPVSGRGASRARATATIPWAIRYAWASPFPRRSPRGRGARRASRAVCAAPGRARARRGRAPSPCGRDRRERRA